MLDIESPESVTQSYQRLFGVSLQVAPQDIEDLSIEQFSFMQKPLDGSPEVQSFFDHEYPNYGEHWTNPVTLFTDDARDYSYGGHDGYDYDTAWEEHILAVANGMIAHAGIRTNEDYCYDAEGNRQDNNPMGDGARYVAIDHDINGDTDPDFRTLYWHLSDNRNPDNEQVWITETVQARQPIGKAGNTGIVRPCPTDDQDHSHGVHLHFAVRADPEVIDHQSPNPCSGSVVDPFGWWSSTRPDPIGATHSRWLWSSSVVVDDLDASFERFTGPWRSEDDAAAWQGHAWSTSTPGSWAVWGLKAPQNGEYYVDVFVPGISNIPVEAYTDRAQYTLYREGLVDSTPYIVNQRTQRGDNWVRLGGSDASPINLGRGEIVLLKLEASSDPSGSYTVFDAAQLEEFLSQREVPIIRPIDPNEKVGPPGSGDTRIIARNDTLDYMINFENLATATAPVQELVIEDYLDPNLDWTTLQFYDIAYGDRVIVMPESVFEFSRRDFPPPSSIIGTTQGPMAIDMTVSLDPETGRIEWRLRAIDTATELPPEDPFAGFLPPEDGTGRGQGHVSFLVKPKAKVAFSTRITNKASIVFDTNAPIETNEVWNTIGRPAFSVYLPLILHSHP